MNRFLILFIWLFFTQLTPAFSQETIVKGKVTDAESGEPLPFANVFFNNSNKGTTTDFDGFFTISISTPVDTLTVIYFGYSKKSKKVKSGIEQNIDFQLSPEASEVEEVVITGAENPAYRILRSVIQNKNKNDKRSLEAYEYESFNKIEISVDNISEKMQDKKVMKQIAKIFDSLKTRAGDDGKPVLPVFVSEAISNFYHRTNPEKTKEVMVATKVSGIGITDGSLTSQLIGSTFQEYNFYKNWLNIVEKDFISPIADEWQGYYQYVLNDSMFLDGKWCYKIDFKPKREQDLAFTGSIWIHDTTFALKQIEATIDKKANINYIEKIKIQQELEPTIIGPWLPVKSRVLIDIAEIKNNSAGLLAKFYTSNRYFNVNNPRPPQFYDRLLEVKEDALVKDQKFWDDHRHDSLTASEKYIYSMVDSIKNVPLVKTYIEILNIAVNGYKKVGKVDLGPYLFAYASNNVEGHRIRIGFKTNIDFSRKWIFKGYGAVSTKDSHHFKYGVETNYILDRKKWTVIGAETRHDIDQLGVSWDILYNSNNTLFLAFTRWGTLRGPYYTTQNLVRFERTYTKDFSQKIILKNRTFDALFPFAYYNNLKNGDSTISSFFNTSEIVLESRYAKDEVFLQNDNDRISMGTKKWPIFTLRTTLGIKGLLGSQFNYQKVYLDANGVIRWGALGRTYYSFTSGKIFSQVPYPLLEVHLGNQSPFYTTAAFNLMNYFEFVSDEFVSLKYRHYFEGLLTNRIPLVKKLKWRFITTGGLVYGSISNKNRAILAPFDQSGQKTVTINSLDQKPYIELGYGIENIFKVLRIDAFHRITYRDSPGVKTFGVKFSFQFIL